MSSGLLRRKAATQHDAALYEDEDQPASSGPNPPRRNAQNAPIVERVAGTGSVAAVDPRSGHRFAYDPRDVNDEVESRIHPRLTLMEEIFLLGLKDKQGYLSFWNDTISVTLRGCILLELAFRGRIGISRAELTRSCISDRTVDVLDTRNTGEPLLDETLRVIKANPPASVSEWISLLTGETWNVLKLNLQLKQVRERLAKGLADKGVLRTEKRNFLLFDMPTHPLAERGQKDALLRRLYAFIGCPAQTLHPPTLYAEAGDIQLRVTRTLCMVCCAYTANVLENPLAHLPYAQHEHALTRAADLLSEFGRWPMAPESPGGGVPAQSTVPSAPKHGTSKRRKQEMGVASADVARAMQHEFAEYGTETQFKLIAAVLLEFSRMDSLL
ncbi:hypothetical protein MVES1_000305 [Malassezia vespertilionis]|uniref:Vps74p n=1 Tax=Malassezia vespertilionis TaxID=2020962 RepID=A0A2N1JGY0_9BASI|nr:uncharacterized protein MVES1_000305 [Malassezia vespertilionis]PKI85795.1 hypothetical protein MVES_000286 [Malassezia vespertilionis]WFD04980.1 hypothetical protein MVES1_000305 [Malassezia vespertilionis]